MNHRRARKAALFLGLILAAVPGAFAKSFQGLKAPTLASPAPQPLDACPTAKCLIVYLAPWCPHCRNATPMILALREYLKTRGVTTRVIIGLDKDGPVRAYAATFGPDTFLDPQGRVSPAGGVPAFLVTDPTGKVVGQRSGAPPERSPFSEAVLAKIAAGVGLP